MSNRDDATPATRRGKHVNSAKALLKMEGAALEKVEKMQVLIDKGKWSETVKNLAQLGVLQTTASVVENYADMDLKDQLNALKTLHGIAKTEMGQPSSLSSSLTVEVRGKDLGMEEMKDLLLGANKPPTKNVTPTDKEERTHDERDNDIQGHQD